MNNHPSTISEIYYKIKNVDTRFKKISEIIFSFSLDRYVFVFSNISS